MDLAKSKKYYNFVKFVLENVDINSTVTLEEEPKNFTTFEFQWKVEGATSIHLAAYFGFNETFEKLMKKYGSPNIPTIIGFTPIDFAAFNGHLRLVKRLADENAVNYAVAPIRNASINGHLEIVKLLADYTDNPNAVFHKSGMTAIHYASLNGHLEIVKFLANFTDTPNVTAFGFDGLTPIHFAAVSYTHLTLPTILLV